MAQPRKSKKPEVKSPNKQPTPAKRRKMIKTPSPEPVEVNDTAAETNVSLLINEVPTEILSEIFYLATYADVDPRYYPCIPVAPAYGPMLLSQVCTRWRRIALDSPKLWAAVCIFPETPLSLLKRWIGLSGDRDFRFFWTFSVKPGRWSLDPQKRSRKKKIPVEDRMKIILSLLNDPQIAERTQSMGFDDLPLYFKHGTPTSNASYPKLQDVFIDTRFSPHGKDILSHLERSSVKGLKRFRSNLTYEFLWPKRDLIFNNVTHLELATSLELDTVLSILELCKVVRILSLASVMNNGDATQLNAPARQVTVGQLETFKLATSCQIIFNHLICPMLQNLHVCFHFVSLTECFSSLSLFLQRSNNASLEKLLIERVGPLALNVPALVVDLVESCGCKRFKLQLDPDRLSGGDGEKVKADLQRDLRKLTPMGCQFFFTENSGTLQCGWNYGKPSEWAFTEEKMFLY